MSERIAQELEMLRSLWPDLEYEDGGHWVRIPKYPVSTKIWNAGEVEVCFQIPADLPGTAPYAFHVRPGLLLRPNDAAPTNYTFPGSPHFGDGWGTFSWRLEPWSPAAEPAAGSNMVNFVRSFADRLRDAS